MPHITIQQIEDYVTLGALVVLGLTPLAHMLVKFAHGLRAIAGLTAFTGDDQKAEEFVVFCEWLARSLDRLAGILPRITAGRISPAVVQAAIDEVKP